MKNIIFKDFSESDFEALKELSDEYLTKIFPLNRSILNSGVKDTLDILKQVIDFDILKINSGYCCYDWEVPEQWEIDDAFIAVDNERIVDFKNNNLHIINYSESVDKIMSFDELKHYLHYIPELPDAIPYKTSYYQKKWGFCLSFNQYQSLPRDKKFHVKIDSSFSKGNIIIGEKILPGETEEEILISAYTCHPSLANDSLSGVIMWVLLLLILSKTKHKYTYRFVLLPETIGSIAYLQLREKDIKENVKMGFVLTTCGGPGLMGYKSSFLGDHIIDNCIQDSFKELKKDFIKYPFDVNGSDERQYSSPYFRIPCITITKDKYYEYPEYHTSLDNLNFVKGEFLMEALEVYLNTIQNLELHQLKFKSLNPACEPFLTKRNLFSTLGITINNHEKISQKHIESIYTTKDNLNITGKDIDLLLWMLFWSDGNNSLIDIAKKSNKHISDLYLVALKLQQLNLIELT
jgi:aminopeptidase-like protein